MVHDRMTKTMHLALARGPDESTTGTDLTISTILASTTYFERKEELIVGMAGTKQIAPPQVERSSNPGGQARCCGSSPRPMKWRRWWSLWPVRSRPRSMGPPCGPKAAWCGPSSDPPHFRLARFRNAANFGA